MIEGLIGGSAAVAGITVGTLSLYIGRKYNRYFWPFIFLSVSFFSYGAAETAYCILDNDGIEPYVTWIDSLYVSYFVFAILHVLFTLHKFNLRGMSLPRLIVILSIMLIMVAAYMTASLSYDDHDHDLINYGLPFVVLASILASLTLITMTYAMKSTLLYKSWMLIGVAIFVSSVTDVWYYTYEVLTGYAYGEMPLMDILWFATDVLIIAGIIIHRRTI